MNEIDQLEASTSTPGAVDLPRIEKAVREILHAIGEIEKDGNTHESRKFANGIRAEFLKKKGW